jgi:fermentation-respiration switch protein FrsA (DUF1100 family)
MRSLITLLTIAAGVYVGLGLLLYLMQNRMVFLANMPGRALTATPADIELAYEVVRIATADGERLHGWYVPADHGHTGVMLFFHGNAGNISHRLDSLAIFHALGLDTLIIDYRGYGESTGSPSEQGTYRDAEAAWNYLVGERGIASERIIVFGRSLGGAVGAWLASRVQPGGVIIESCFSSGADMAKRLYPFLPARLITRLRYPVTDYVRDIQSPLLVVHSRDDEIIPFDMGQAIFRAAPEPKSFLALNGDHNMGFLLSREAYLAGLESFITKQGAGVN